MKINNIGNKLLFEGESKFSPSKTNFHNLDNIDITSLNYYKVKEWRESKEYNELCKRLYNDGLRIFKELFEEYYFPKKYTEEDAKHHLYVLHTYADMSDDEYEYNMKHLKEYAEMLDNNFKKTREIGQTKTLQFKVGLYQNVFGYGYEHFINITKENGHVLNGLEFITYSGSDFHVLK